MRHHAEQHRGSGRILQARLNGLDRAVARQEPAALVLLLHGGRADSFDPVRRGNLPALRMGILARALRPRIGVPVLILRNRYRGWNDEDGTHTPCPVQDAVWALKAIERALGPVPVILVGHSMGGRAAVRAASHPSVRAVAALAPWLPPGEPVGPLRNRSVLIAHGRHDRVTAPEHSAAFARRAATVADHVRLEVVDDGHAMLRSPATWHALVHDFVLAQIHHAHLDA